MNHPVRLETRRGKYNAKRTQIGEYTFDSLREAARYQELRLREAAGEIELLRVHATFHLCVKEIPVCDYVADFIYWEKTGDSLRYVVEDVKGVKTAVYRLKKKLMFACLGITITDIQ